MVSWAHFHKGWRISADINGTVNCQGHTPGVLLCAPLIVRVERLSAPSVHWSSSVLSLQTIIHMARIHRQHAYPLLSILVKQSVPG